MQVLVSNTGVIQSGTTAKDSAGVAYTVTSGSLILNVTNCKVSGKILIKPTGAVTPTQIDVVHTTLSLDDHTIMGVGFIAGKPITLMGVRVNTL